LGYSVQLKYDKKENTWGDHGDVKVLNGDTVLAESKKMIHNNSWGRWNDLVEKSEALAKEAIASLPKKDKVEENKDNTTE